MDLAGVLRKRLLAPRVGHRLEHGDQRGGGGEHDLLAGCVLEQPGVGVERLGEQRLARQEHDDELGCGTELSPVRLGSQRVDVLAHLLGVTDQPGSALTGVGGVRRRQEGIEGDLCIDHEVLAAGKLNDDVRPEDSLVGDSGDLLFEGAMVAQAGHLEAAPQLHLSPVPADLRAPQRFGEGASLSPHLLAAQMHGIDLRLQLRLP